MPVSGYVLHLNPQHEDSALQAIKALAAVEVGEKTAGGWPLVAEAATLGDFRDLEQQICELPGVISLTPVYHNFEEDSKDTERVIHEK